MSRPPHFARLSDELMAARLAASARRLAAAAPDRVSADWIRYVVEHTVNGMESAGEARRVSWLVTELADVFASTPAEREAR